MNKNGESTTNTDFDMTDDISTKSYYGNIRGVCDKLEIRQNQIKFSGLDEG